MDGINNETGQQVVNQASVQTTQTQERPCPHDCRRCNPGQQIYCCTKMVYDLSRSLQEVKSEIRQLKEEMNGVQTYIPTKTDEFITPEIEEQAQ